MSERENLKNAQGAKKDEFYTQYSDIEKEMNAYFEYDKDVFRGKTVLCPCDDPEWSNFTKYFIASFEKLGLKKLISTSYAKSYGNKTTSEFEKSSSLYDALKHDTHGKVFTVTKKDIKKVDFDDIHFKYLEGDGDFRSDEVCKLRDEADIIVTNPPFSLFREFLAWIRESDKKFVMIGNQNAITYKEVFPLIKNDEIWLGNGFAGNVGFFESPYEDTAKSSQHKEGLIRVSGVMWFTNIDYGHRHEKMNLMTMADNIKFNKKVKKKFDTDYNGINYPKYDNYDAIEIPVTEAIPSDYNGVMGVPITFLTKYCPEQFEIVGLGNSRENFMPNKDYINPKKHTKDGKIVNGGAINCVLAIEQNIEPSGVVYYTSENSKYLISPYARILIKHRKDIS